jgi:hypothetical protein
VTDPTPAPPLEGGLRWSWAAVDAWGVVARCEAVLAGVAAVAAVAVSAVQQSDLGAAISFLSWVWAVHAVITLVVGYPLGVVVSRLLPPRPGRGHAAGVYALVGGAAAALIVLLGGTGSAAAGAWAVLGAVTAGSARFWGDRVIRDRAVRREALALATPPGRPLADDAGVAGGV